MGNRIFIKLQKKNNFFIESYTGQNLRDSQKSLKGTCLESMYQKRL